jgi:enediyne biosynthesis protein E4
VSLPRTACAIAALLLALLLVAAEPSFPRYENIAASAGLVHSFPNGGDHSKQFIIETTGSGLGFIDYDNDGLPDLLVLSGEGGTNRLYHNLGGKHFRDVTDQMGMRSSGWAQGVCTGDYDNDGFTDLLITYWGQNRLYRNLAGKRFEEVSAAAGLTQTRIRYNTGCAFTDVDRDGHLDLFVANYLKFDPATTPKPGANPYCFYRGIAVSCGPRGLPFDRNLLYHNNGNGTFTDISESSGVAAPLGHYGLSVLTGDFTEDGLPDIYVACDQTPSLLYVNQGHNKFEEEAVLRGVAFDQNGKEMSGMGVDAADYIGDGHSSIFRTNFSDEFETLYRNRKGGNFDDVTLDAGLGGNTRFVGWGTAFLDFDNDGWPDIFLVNGHAFPEVDTLHIDVRYKDRAILYRNLQNGKFADISEHAGAGILEKHSSRGAASADIDNSGYQAIAVNNQNEPISLLAEQASNGNHWVSVQLAGTRSNRSAIGARVRLKTGAHTQSQEVRSGGSYLSQNDLRLHFGLGSATTIDRLEVIWPTGKVDVLVNQNTNRILQIKEQK